MSRVRGLLAAHLAVAFLFRVGAARAQAAGFALSRFEPSERGSEWFALDSLDFRGHGRWNAGVVADGAYRPLAIFDSNGDLRTALVRHQIFVHPGASLVLWNRVRFGLSVPFVVYQDGEGGTIRGVAYAAPGTPAFGDIRLSGDVRLVGEYGDPATLAAGIAFHVPTGSRDDFTSDGTMRIEPRVLAAGDIAAFTWAAKLGFQYRGLDERLDDSPIGSEVTFAAAAGVRLADRKLVLGPEIFGSTGVSDSDAFFKMKSTPLDAILGAHWTLAEEWRLGAGAGVGLTQGFGSPEARYMISMERVAPSERKRPRADRDQDGVLDAADACPDTPGVTTSDSRTNGCPPDRDRDGVLDTNDACPEVAGVETSDPKTSGCPPDRDADGVLDRNDACPEAAGVETSDPKTNGCPPDRDADGVLDRNDACPDTAGIETSDPKTNGCPPDPDRDKDGIPNERDACPDEAGRPNPDPKKNGCPLAYVAEAQIKIIQQVKFVTNSSAILPGKESEDVLNAVLKVLDEHAEIKHVRVEGHTDNMGSAAHNKKLSQARAESVSAWLVRHGVPKDHLAAAGFGMERPIADNGTPEGRHENRRVEFHIENDPAKPTP